MNNVYSNKSEHKNNMLYGTGKPMTQWKETTIIKDGKPFTILFPELTEPNS